MAVGLVLLLWVFPRDERICFSNPHAIQIFYKMRKSNIVLIQFPVTVIRLGPYSISTCLAESALKFYFYRHMQYTFIMYISLKITNCKQCLQNKVQWQCRSKTCSKPRNYQILTDFTDSCNGTGTAASVLLVTSTSSSSATCIESLTIQYSQEQRDMPST